MEDEIAENITQFETDAILLGERPVDWTGRMDHFLS
jgi:hypothetical protein